MIVMQIMMVSGERDTIRGVQIRAGAILYIHIYMYGGTCALGFEFSSQSSVYDATTVAKVSLFFTWTQSTVSFYSM